MAEKKEEAAAKKPAAKKAAPKAAAKKAAPKKAAAKKETPKAEKAEKVEKAPKVEAKAETKKAPAKKAAPKKREEIKPLADFDWSMISKREEKYAEADQKEMEAAYDQTLTSIEDQQVLDGVVTRKTNRDVVINIGYKSEAVISISEFRYKIRHTGKHQIKIKTSVQLEKSTYPMSPVFAFAINLAIARAAQARLE
mgnify:CR=1 FL=1